MGPFRAGANTYVRWNDEIDHHLGFFPVKVYHDVVTNRTSYHRQPGFEIHVTNAGRGMMIVDDTPIAQSTRQVVVLNGHIPHQLLAEPSYRRTVICIDPGKLGAMGLDHMVRMEGLIKDRPELFTSMRLMHDDFRRLMSASIKIAHELEHKPRGWDRTVVAATIEVNVILERALDQSHHRERARGAGKEILSACCRYIGENLAEDSSLSRVSAILGVSSEHFSRLFRLEMNMGYLEYVHRLRVRQAEHLLALPTRPTLEHIASEVGFSSGQHLTRVFKRLTGMTPTSYRESLSDIKN